MANEIHNYPLEIYTIGNNDYLDVDYWNGVGYDSSKIQGLNLRSSLKTGMYTMISNGTYVTGTGEQDILNGSYLGTLSVPANTFVQGDSFRLKICGQIGAKNNDTLTIKIKSGSTILSVSPAIVMPAISLDVFELDCHFVIRQTGGSMVASLITNSTLTWNKSSANIFEGQNWIAVNNTTFDTSIINTLSVTTEFSSSHVDNHIQSMVATLEKIY